MRQHGVSLLESLMAVSLMLVIAGMAAPSYPQVKDRVTAVVQQYRQLLVAYLAEEAAAP